MRGFCAVLFALTVSGMLVGRARAEEYDLEIITPHSDVIQAEFERAFLKQVGKPLKIRWIRKGTGQIIQQLEAQDKAAKGGTFGLDVFFGGGVPDHNLAASKGFLEPANIPADILAGIPKEIAGVANFGEKNIWIGSALSAFGVLINARGLEAQKLPPITKWADLGEPCMYSWVVIADPRKSSSVRVSYELILQQYGWEKGWPLLMQIAANSRLISDASSNVPNEIATGNVLAGPCIDFYAYGRVAQAGEGVLRYINPVGGSAITPDPIAMLRKPPHKELAEKFIAFVLSPAGQRLWALPAGAPGGPEKSALYRMPVRPDVCQEEAERLVIKDPYKEAEAGTFRKMNDDMQRARNTLLSELMGVAVVDLNRECREAWKTLIDGGQKPAALEEWRKLPFSEPEGLELGKKLDGNEREARQITREWNRFFKAKYDKVRELSK